MKSLFKSRRSHIQETEIPQPEEEEQNSQLEDMPAAAEENRDAVVEEARVVEEPPVCQTSDRLKSYPLLKEASDSFNEFGIIKAIKNSSVPVFKPIGEFINSQSLLRPIVQTVDGVGVSTLNGIERVVPCFKTMTSDDVLVGIKTPIVRADQTVKGAVTATSDCVENNIVSPTRKLVRDSRAFYNEKLYDTKGKPLLRSSFDPVFRPINYQLENFTLTNLPEGEPVMVEYSSEVERNVYLSINFVDRLIPAVENKIVGCLMVPCNYTTHVVEVYNENLNKELELSVNSSIKAIYNTTVELTNEAISESTSLWRKVWNGKDPAVSPGEPIAVLAESHPAAPVQSESVSSPPVAV